MFKFSGCRTEVLHDSITGIITTNLALSQIIQLVTNLLEVTKSRESLWSHLVLPQMPGSGVPMQMMAQQQHDGMQQSRGQQQQVRHSNKPTGYGGWPQSNS